VIIYTFGYGELCPRNGQHVFDVGWIDRHWIAEPLAQREAYCAKRRVASERPLSCRGLGAVRARLGEAPDATCGKDHQGG
jgi:hypothetical protein